MIRKKPGEVRKTTGKYICVYGEPKVGKTVTTLKTAPGPIMWVTVEPRDFKRSIEAVDKKDLKYELAIYENFMDVIKFFSDADTFKDFKTVFFDGLSYLHNIVLPAEIQEEEFVEDSKSPIRAMTKSTLPQQGERNNGIFRILRLIGKNVVARDKIAIVSCLEMDNIKYNKVISNQSLIKIGPSLGGKEVPSNFPGFFDLIGKLFHNIDKSGKKYPPIVSFDDSGEYLAGWTGNRPSDGLLFELNWTKILELA